MAERNKQIDIVKGLLIILVIIGHFPFLDQMAPYIFWFHMPAFFMLSGMFIKYKGMLLLEIKKRQ